MNTLARCDHWWWLATNLAWFIMLPPHSPVRACPIWVHSSNQPTIGSTISFQFGRRHARMKSFLFAHVKYPLWRHVSSCVCVWFVSALHLYHHPNQNLLAKLMETWLAGWLTEWIKSENVFLDKPAHSRVCWHWPCYRVGPFRVGEHNVVQVFVSRNWHFCCPSTINNIPQ